MLSTGVRPAAQFGADLKSLTGIPAGEERTKLPLAYRVRTVTSKQENFVCSKKEVPAKEMPPVLCSLHSSPDWAVSAEKQNF